MWSFNLLLRKVDYFIEHASYKRLTSLCVFMHVWSRYYIFILKCLLQAKAIFLSNIQFQFSPTLSWATNGQKLRLLKSLRIEVIRPGNLRSPKNKIYYSSKQLELTMVGSIPGSSMRLRVYCGSSRVSLILWMQLTIKQTYNSRW